MTHPKPPKFKAKLYYSNTLISGNVGVRYVDASTLVGYSSLEIGILDPKPIVEQTRESFVYANGTRDNARFKFNHELSFYPINYPLQGFDYVEEPEIYLNKILNYRYLYLQLPDNMKIVSETEELGVSEMKCHAIGLIDYNFEREGGFIRITITYGDRY